MTDDLRVRRTDPPRTKIIEKGLSVPHGLQVNELTLSEHQAWLEFANLKPLNYTEACRIHGVEEANNYFHRDQDAHEDAMEPLYSWNYEPEPFRRTVEWRWNAAWIVIALADGNYAKFHRKLELSESKAEWHKPVITEITLS